MRLIEKIIFAGNVFFWLIIASFLFQIKTTYGWAGILSAGSFVILFFNARYFIISKLKRFIDSDWRVFRVKMKWANGMGMIILIVLIVLFNYLFNR